VQKKADLEIQKVRGCTCKLYKRFTDSCHFHPQALATHSQCIQRVLRSVQTTQPLKYPPVTSPAIKKTSYMQRLRRLLAVCVPSPFDRDALRSV
jgi:hypothetical protein